MSDRNGTIDLRTILAKLYPDVDSARRIAKDAGLEDSRISFSQHAINNWDAILAEAVKMNQLDMLTRTVFQEYGQNPALFDAWTSAIREELQNKVPTLEQLKRERENRETFREEQHKQVSKNKIQNRYWFGIAVTIIGLNLIYAQIGAPIENDGPFFSVTISLIFLILLEVLRSYAVGWICVSFLSLDIVVGFMSCLVVMFISALTAVFNIQKLVLGFNTTRATYAGELGTYLVMIGFISVILIWGHLRKSRITQIRTLKNLYKFLILFVINSLMFFTAFAIISQRI